MSETKLLPCPWCGGTDDDLSQTIESDNDSPVYLVECINGDCGAKGPYAEFSPEDAIELWNTRTDPRLAAADAMAKALEEAVSIFDIYGAGMFRGPCERAIRSSLAAYNALK